MLLKSGSLPTDATLKNCPFLSDVLSAGAVECDFTNYSRIVIGTPASISVNTGTGVVTADIPDQIWNGAGGAVNNTTGAFLICYRKTSGAADSVIRVLTKHGYGYGTTGGNMPASIPSIGTAT